MYDVVVSGIISVPVDHPNLAPVLITGTLVVFALSLAIVVTASPGDDRTFGKLIPSTVLLILATLFSTGAVSAKQQASYEAEVHNWLDSNANIVCFNHTPEVLNGYAMSYDPVSYAARSQAVQNLVVQVDLTRFIETDENYLTKRDDGVYIDCYGSGALDNYLGTS